MIQQKKKPCKVCERDEYIFSKGKCRRCSESGSKQIKSGKKGIKRIDFSTEDLDSLTISQLKRIADYELRQFLLRQNNSNLYYCPIKKRNFSPENMEVAHFIDRKHLCTRYDLENCQLISKQSNTWDSQVPKEGYKSLHHYDYEMYLGKEKVKKLLEKSKNICIFARQDYINIIKSFRNNE